VDKVSEPVIQKRWYASNRSGLMCSLKTVLVPQVMKKLESLNSAEWHMTHGHVMITEEGI
jgi:hypothetical protein